MTYGGIEMWKKHPVFFTFSIIIILYLLPTFIQVQFDTQAHVQAVSFGLPGVLSGDEPHYLVVTSSLINDYDYTIENNYDNAYYAGECDVGFRFINNTSPLVGRHMMLFNKEKKILTFINAKNEFNSETYAEELQLLYEKYNVTKFEQINSRPLGLPLLSAIFLWPLKETCYIEPAAIFLTVCVSFIGIIFFYLICLTYIRKYKNEYSQEKVISLSLIFTFIFALCTQGWHYSKTYFTEPYLLTILLVAYYLFFIKKQSFIPGLLLAWGFLMKSPFGMYLALFGIFLLHDKEWKRIIYLIGGSMGPLAIFFYLNWALTGKFLYLARSEYLSLFDHYVTGIFSSLFDPISGIILFAPFLLFSLIGVWTLYKKDKQTLVYCGIVIIPYFLFWTSLCLTEVGTGSAYSNRYLVPLLGFFVLLTAVWYIHNSNKMLNILFWITVALSLFINVQAAFLYFLFWNNPPWILYIKLMTQGNKIVELIKVFL